MVRVTPDLADLVAQTPLQPYVATALGIFA
jgi:hypothetical protein